MTSPLAVPRVQAVGRGISGFGGAGTPATPYPPSWAGPMSILVVNSQGIPAWYNAHMTNNDYSSALYTQDVIYSSAALGAGAITKGHRYIGVGPNQTAAQIQAAFADALSFGCDGINWGDETSQTASKLLNGWIQQFTGVTTTLQTAVVAGDTTFTVATGTRYINDGLTPAPTSLNAFPSVAVGGTPYTIQFGDNGEQVVIANNNASGNPTVVGTNTWSVQLRGANQSGYGSAASGQAASSHAVGTKITLIYADPGATAMRSLLTTFNTANASSLKLNIVLLGAAIASMAQSDLNSIFSSNADVGLYQTQRLLNMDVPSSSDIAGYAAAVATNVGKLRTALGAGKPCGIQCQVYNPTTGHNYSKSISQSLIDYAGASSNPTWINVFYGSFVSGANSVEDVITPNYRV